MVLMFPKKHRTAIFFQTFFSSSFSQVCRRRRALKKSEFGYSSITPVSPSAFIFCSNAYPRPKKPGTFCFIWLRHRGDGLKNQPSGSETEGTEVEQPSHLALTQRGRRLNNPAIWLRHRGDAPLTFSPKQIVFSSLYCRKGEWGG